jgi:hypothetical protein
LGSFFAGIKSGTLAGVLYVGSMAAFNVILLYALQSSVLKAINAYDPVSCPMIPNVNGSVQDCFNSVVSVDVPFIAFVAFFITLLYAGIFGSYYDSLPGRGPTIRGVVFAAIIGANLVFFGYSGYVFDAESAAATGIFLIAWTPALGYLLGRLYKKYTRVVSFSSQDGELLRVVVDGRDMTGRTRTFATTSNHRLAAHLADDASFKEWAHSGGVALEDPRSFETVIEVNGDGTIDGKVGKKY